MSYHVIKARKPLQKAPVMAALGKHSSPGTRQHTHPTALIAVMCRNLSCLRKGHRLSCFSLQPWLSSAMSSSGKLLHLTHSHSKLQPLLSAAAFCYELTSVLAVQQRQLHPQ